MFRLPRRMRLQPGEHNVWVMSAFLLMAMAGHHIQDNAPKLKGSGCLKVPLFFHYRVQAFQKKNDSFDRQSDDDHQQYEVMS